MQILSPALNTFKNVHFGKFSCKNSKKMLYNQATEKGSVILATVY